MEIVKKIKSERKLSLKDSFLCAYLISQRLSPYFSSYYIKRNIKPNKITLHMIYSGAIGAILFSIPNTYVKIIGAIFIHIWFVLDCSDGEVARHTKTFSKYGHELDFVAHLINHPLFAFSLFCSMAQLGRYNLNYLAIVILISNLLDYLNRNIFTLGLVVNLKSSIKKSVKNNSNKWTIKEIILFVTSIFTLYPNLILFGVIIYFVDYKIGTDILYVYLLGNVLVTGLFAIIGLFKLTKKFYRSN